MSTACITSTGFARRQPATTSRPACRPLQEGEGARVRARRPTRGRLDVQRLLGQYGGWGAATGSRGGNKYCFASAKPKTTEMEPAGPRGQSYLSVSTGPAQKVKNEVRLVIGYPFKSNSGATVEIGTAKFAMWTQIDRAYIKPSIFIDEVTHRAENARMVDAMRKGADMTVKGTSDSGAQSTDQYSLEGFAQALDKIEQECTEQSTAAPAPAQSTAAPAPERLKPAGSVKIRTRTPGCEDIATALNTPGGTARNRS